MSDHVYERTVLLANGHRFDVGSSHGVCDLARSEFDEVGNLTSYFYEHMDPEDAIELAEHIYESALAAKNFHAEVVAQLRASQNGYHDEGDPDGEA